MSNHEFLLDEKRRISAICMENSDDYKSRIELAGINAQLGDIEAVVECCKQVIQIKPDLPDVHYNLGFALHRLGNIDEASICYRETINHSPSHISAHLNLGAILRQQGNVDEAYSYFKKILELQNDQKEALFGSGICCLDLKKFSDACSYFELYLKCKPDSCEAYSKLGVAQLRLGLIEQALISLEMATNFNPDHAEAYFYRKYIQHSHGLHSNNLNKDQAIPKNDGLEGSEKIENCISNVINYFSDQDEIKPDYPYIYFYLQKKFGIKCLFNKEKIFNVFKSRKEDKGYGSKDNFLLFFRIIDPEFSVPDHILDRQSTLPIDGTTLQALYCDRWSSFSASSFLERLKSDIGLNGYYATHALMAIQFVKENMCISNDDLSSLEEQAVISCLDQLLTTDEFNDLSIEAAAILQYAGYGYLMRHDWIMGIIDVQKEDGGWLWDKNHEKTHTHTSILALWALLEFIRPGNSMNWIEA